MKILAGLAALGMLGGGLYATDALTAGTLYEKPYEQAYAELASMPLLPVAGPAHPGSGSMVVEREPGTIGWRIAVGSVEVGRFTARLSPAGARRTRVSVEFATSPAQIGVNPILASELMTNFARLAMVEQVDARLENRPPDMGEIHLAAARHLQANPEQLRAFGGAVQAQFQRVDSMLRADQSPEWAERLERIEKSYAPPPYPEDATRPTTDLSRFN